MRPILLPRGLVAAVAAVAAVVMAEDLVLAGEPSAEVTVESLLDEMVDLDRLAWPADYTCRQFSSYDRASKAPTDEKGWFANGDRGQYLRVDANGEHVLAEADGPGAIVRIWSADPGGTIRVYLDGAVALEADFAALTQGRVEPFGPPFGGRRANGCNLYFPFPYARSMKVTTSTGGQYYHVNVRTYPKGTKVRTYAGPPPVEAMKLIAARLDAGEPAPVASGAPPAGGVSPFGGSLELDGPRTITELELSRIEGDLRQATITMTFDGELCVCAPLGDFFGAAPDAPAYATLALATRPAWRSTFPMPFSKKARIEVEGAKVEGEVRHRPGDAPLRFHAWWRGKARISTRPMIDWPILRGEGGRGRYVGTALFLRNPVRTWWGEGDEKVYVDGEAFPSTFGTGTEDYFGYAWGSPELFEHPYHAQSRCDGPGTRGFTALARLHLIDDIPFASSIRFDLELWHWAECEVSYATIAYFYAEPGFRLDFESPDPPNASEREVIPLPDLRAVKVPGSIEGEGLAVLEKTGGVVVETQDMLGFGDGWSSGKHLWWRGGKPGDAVRLEVEAPAEAAGRKKLVLALTKAPDYGIVKIAWNGAVLAERVDLYDPAVVPAGERAFEVDVRAGANELRLEIAGTNEKAAPKNYMAGLDYVRFE